MKKNCVYSFQGTDFKSLIRLKKNKWDIHLNTDFEDYYSILRHCLQLSLILLLESAMMTDSRRLHLTSS